MALTDKNLTLAEVHEYLNLNGIEWSFGWVKTQVNFGRIPSQKLYNSRVVNREELARFVSKYKAKKAGMA